MSGNKCYHQRFGRKNSYPNQIAHTPPPPPPLKCQMVGPLVRNKPGIKPVENAPPEELTLEIITLNSRRSIY